MKLKYLVIASVVMIFASGCSTTHRTMREPNAYIEFSLDDFELSEQVTAEARSTMILGIDWQRLFKSETGSVDGGASMLIDLASIPVMGGNLLNRTANYALYEMMVQNPNYDVVIYPQYETKKVKPFLGMGFILTRTEVKATARLGRLK